MGKDSQESKSRKGFKWYYFFGGIILVCVALFGFIWTLSFITEVESMFDLNKSALETFNISQPVLIDGKLFLSKQYQGMVFLIGALSVFVFGGGIYWSLDWLLGRIILVKLVWKIALGLVVILGVVLLAIGILLLTGILKENTFGDLALFSKSPAINFMPKNWIL